MAQKLNQVPPVFDVWLVDGTHYLVRFNDRVQPPIPMVWKVEDSSRREALGIEKVNRTMSRQEFLQTGAVNFGGSLELWNTTVDPLKAFYSNFEAELKVKPFLQDPDILTLFMQAAHEQREVSDAELQTTEWWREHSDVQRQWLSLNASDPATANNLVEDNRRQVAQLFRDAGISNATDQLVQTVADQWTQGEWTQVYALDQIRLLADPNLDGTLDPLLTTVAPSLDTTRQGEDTVQNMIQTWLGPATAENWNQDHIQKWASRLREDPDARIELEDVLRKHRLALFPEYENANLTYEDIAAPWRGVWSNILGEVADETSGLFTRIVRLNDRGQAERELRKHGLNQGNATVSQSLLSQLNQAFGGQIRRSDPAVL